MTNDRRRENYIRQNGTDRLTPKQKKRLRLRAHREGERA